MHTAESTASGISSQPHSVGKSRYRMRMGKIDSKKVLWENVKRLMQHRYGKENLTRLAGDAGIGPGSMTIMKHYFALSSLPKVHPEHAKITEVIRTASKGDFKQFPVPGGIAYVFASQTKPWDLSFSRILLNTDSVMIMEIGEEVTHTGFGAMGGWINSHRPYK